MQLQWSTRSDSRVWSRADENRVRLWSYDQTLENLVENPIRLLRKCKFSGWPEQTLEKYTEFVSLIVKKKSRLWSRLSKLICWKITHVLMRVDSQKWTESKSRLLQLKLKNFHGDSWDFSKSFSKSFLSKHFNT